VDQGSKAKGGTFHLQR